MVREDQNKTGSDYTPDKIAEDHNALAIHAIEENTGYWSGDDGGQHARDHYRADGQPGPGQVQGQAQDRDAVEVVTDLADNLADPGKAIVSVISQQPPKRIHADLS